MHNTFWRAMVDELRLLHSGGLLAIEKKSLLMGLVVEVHSQHKSPGTTRFHLGVRSLSLPQVEKNTSVRLIQKAPLVAVFFPADFRFRCQVSVELARAHASKAPLQLRFKPCNVHQMVCSQLAMPQRPPPSVKAKAAQRSSAQQRLRR